MALYSPSGKSEDRVEPADVDPLDNIGGTLDGDCPVGMNDGNLKWPRLGLELLLCVFVCDMNKVANFVLMGKAALVFLFVIDELAATAAFIHKLPVGDIGGADNHVASKHNLARCGGKGCVIGGAEGKSDALQHLEEIKRLTMLRRSHTK